jgi:outer membrane protein assembly factor BamB/ribosomal protein L7/L12
VRCKFCGNVSLIPGVLPTQAAAPASALDEIRQLAGGGNLVDAIERYRATYGVDQGEAKDAIDALQAGRLVTPSALGMRAPEELTKALEEVQRLLAAGNKIEAIKVYRENYDVSMQRAKYALEQIAAGQTAWPEAGFQGPVTQLQDSVSPLQEARTGKVGKWLGCSITMAIILLVGGILAFALLQPGGPFTPHYYPGDKAALIPSGTNASPDIAVWFYNSNADNRFIGLVGTEAGKLNWKAAPLAGDGYVDALAASPDLVYAASGTDLLAYHKSDGSLAWQAQMPDKLNYGDSTLLITDGRVITNNVDQSIQAYDAETGSLVWSRQMAAYDRALRLMGNSLVVVDYPNSDYNYGLVFLDPATGEQQNVLTPTCTHNDYSYNALGTNSDLAYDPAGNVLYLVSDASYACLERIDLVSGQVVWQTTRDESFSFASDGFQSLMTDSTLYFSNGNDILAVNKSTGEMKVLLTNPDYDLLPLAVADDKLIVRARRTRGTERFELWGVEAASGSQAWQMDLQGAAPIDPPDEMVGLVDDTDWGWTWKLFPGGLVVVKFQGKPNRLVLETFNPADGTSQGKQTLALNKVSGDFYSIPTVIGWQGSVAYLSLESNIYALDVATGKMKVVY